MEIYEIEGNVMSEDKPETKKKAARKSISKEEMDEIVDALFERIKKELDFTEGRIYKGLKKENTKDMEMIMERFTDLDEKIK